jgi:hypothetical protein
MADNPLVGTWWLVTIEFTSSDGQVGQPYGPEPIGYLIHAPDGHLSVAFMSAGRPNFASADPDGWTDAERHGAVATFGGYAGSYEFLGDREAHHIEVCIVPNMVGRTLEQRVELAGNRLTLVSPALIVGGTEITGKATWERARPAERQG